MAAHTHRPQPDVPRRPVVVGDQAEQTSPSAERAAGALANLVVETIIRLPKVQELSGLGRSTIYRLMATQQFPSAVRLGPRAVGWRLSDIAAWSASRPCITPMGRAGPERPAHPAPPGPDPLSASARGPAGPEPPVVLAAAEARGSA